MGEAIARIGTGRKPCAQGRVSVIYHVLGGAHPDSIATGDCVARHDTAIYAVEISGAGTAAGGSIRVIGGEAWSGVDNWYRHLA